MKIIDWYILKSFIKTFLFTLLILLPITVAIDVAEKIDKFLNNESLTFAVLVNDYYKNFVVYFGNTFMPLALFLAIIIFTSRLSSNTEVIAINDAQVSFTRFLYPYFIGATLVMLFSLGMNHYIVPLSNKVKTAFEKEYLGKKGGSNNIYNYSLQLNDSSFVHLKSFNLKTNTGYRFSIDTYDGIKLKHKLTAQSIKWNPADSTFKLSTWTKRSVLGKRDFVLRNNVLDTVFSFSPKDFSYKDVMSNEIQTPELKEFIAMSKSRGIKNLNAYWVELYKRTSLPIASYVLTLIAVCMSYRKRRGGIGVNIALGLLVMFLYVFFLKVAEVLGSVPDVNPMLYVWMPNMLFGTFAIYLYFRATR